MAADRTLCTRSHMYLDTYISVLPGEGPAQEGSSGGSLHWPDPQALCLLLVGELPLLLKISSKEGHMMA